MIKKFLKPDNWIEGYDCIIVGSGIAGLYTALEIPENLRVLVLSKSTLEESNSSLAQGGIAVSKDEDVARHFEDTKKAGVYLNHESNLFHMVDESWSVLEKLMSYGVNFDRDELGNLLVTMEGGHSGKRIYHYKDITGWEITRALISACKNKSNITFCENFFAMDLLVCKGEVQGIYGSYEHKITAYKCNQIVLATGGIGGLYKRTTNVKALTGDGIAMAMRAGAAINHMEFVQFHPTGMDGDLHETFLISEAVRGEGAYLVDETEHRIMDDLHILKELAPRDIVAKEMYKRISEGHKMYLDLRHLDSEFVMKRFPNIYEKCLKHGYDMIKDLIPVTPTQHYMIGGIVIDADGRTPVEGLYACGECAASGVHGANRLASNSLLEAIVFAGRVSKKITRKSIHFTKTCYNFCESSSDTIGYDINLVRQVMTTSGFIERSVEEIGRGLIILEKELNRLMSIVTSDVQLHEYINMLYVAREILTAASKRKTSIGCHQMKGS